MRSLGIDVGGVSRGHAAVLIDERPEARSLGTALSCVHVAALVSQHKPDVVAIDSPPRCGLAGGSRACERELLRAGIHSFPTPSDRRRIESHKFFAWMKEGFRVFEALAPDYPLFLGGEVRGRAVEVFPHATACVLGGGPEPTRQKRAHRRRLLGEVGIDTSSLRTADEVDAALAAYTGWLALRGACLAVGDPEEGVIVIPSGSVLDLGQPDLTRSPWAPSMKIATRGRGRLGTVAATLLMVSVGLSACAAITAATNTRHPAAPISQAPVAPCSTTAVAQIQPADDPQALVVPNFPPSRLPRPGLQPLTQAEAENAARTVHARNTSGTAPSNAPTSSREMSYSAWVKEAGLPLDKFINPDRCIWVVTVQAPFTPPAPYNVTPVTHSSYTVVIDAGTHYVIDVTAR